MPLFIEFLECETDCLEASNVKKLQKLKNIS